MSQLSPHFSRSEFACQCGCGFDTVDTDTLEVLERIRVKFAAPITITSGCRCTAHNTAIGGATNSQHVHGRAADIQVHGVKPSDVQSWVEQNIPRASVGRYEIFTHVDTRTNGPARWKG